ncbi:hypothetical protein AAVH_17432 [Aphelenchoides avenae]|nr:hypothetical protein AAVH_17432 [Aphelenchus avenae]
MGGGNPFVIGAVTPTKRFTKRRSDGRTPRKRAIIDGSEDESIGIFSPPMRAGPSTTGVTLRRRAVIEDSDEEFNAVSSQPSRPETSKRLCLTTDRGYDSFDDPDADEAANKACQDVYDSMDDEEENRRMGELCAASPLETENAQLKAQVARLRVKLEETAKRRDSLEKIADEHLQAFRLEIRERARLEREMSELDAQLEEQHYAIGHLEAELEDERKKNRELKRKLRDPAATTGIAGICKCLFSADVPFDSAPDGTIYARAAKRPLGCQHYDILKVLGKYDDGDAWWHVGTGAWTVAYHGTTLASAQQIVRNGFHMSKAQRAARLEQVSVHRPRVHSQNHYKVIIGTAMASIGTGYRAVLQCFVDPREKQLGRHATERGGEYWVMPGGYAIRPYAVCLFSEP